MAKKGKIEKWQPAAAQLQPVCQNGGNQFRLLASSKSPNGLSVTLSRTGLEGVVGFVDSAGNSSSYNHDDFSTTLRLPVQTIGVSPASTMRLASDQDTNSMRSCSLMSADCFNDTHAFFLYRCSDKTLATRMHAATAADAATGPHFQVAVYYSLPSTVGGFANKELQICQLDTMGRACDNKAAFAVLNTTLWDGLHKL
jgi:hypothetical protein